MAIIKKSMQLRKYYKDSNRLENYFTKLGIHMRLSDVDIEKYLDQKIIQLEPRPSNDKISGATVDIRLGNKFRVFQEYSAPYIDLSGNKSAIKEQLDLVMSDEIFVTENDKFFLHPGVLALATTYETVTLSDNIIGWLDGRSSLARLGLMVHVTAHRIDPGWHGKIVLEFYNSGKLPLALQPGMNIGALSFEILSTPAIKPYNKRADAKYKNQQAVLASKIDED